MAYALVDLKTSCIIELCHCKSPTCLLQHPAGACGTSVSRRVSSKRRTPYCFVCRSQRHFLESIAAKVSEDAVVVVVVVVVVVAKVSEDVVVVSLHVACTLCLVHDYFY